MVYTDKMMTGSLRFAVASYNVHKCVGMDGRFDPERTARVIEELGADILALQEVDRRRGTREGLLDLEGLARRTGLVPVPLPQRLSDLAHGWHGNLVLVREGWAATAQAVDLPGLEPRGALIVDVVVGAVRLRIIAAHLGLLPASRRKQVELISSFIADHPEQPVLIMGDLNEWRNGRSSSLALLRGKMGAVLEPRPSFPARLPAITLDRILARPKHLIRTLHVHDTHLSRRASDHLPLRAEIELPQEGDDHPAC